MTSAPALESFWDYREHFRRLMRGTAGTPAESAGDYRPQELLTPLNERLIQAIWAHQMIQPEGLRLADGRPVRVLDPGRWNGMGGPDFREAKLMVGAQTLTGDIEIHLNASEWRAHRHESDMDYNGVIAHVVYKNDDGRKSDALHNGSEAPRLELEPYLFPDLETIRRSLSPDDYSYGEPGALGKCYPLMTGADPVRIADFLDRAGDERLIAKIRRLDDQLRHLATEDLEQVFHQSLLMSLGSGAGKSLFYLLAKRAPFADLLDFAAEAPEGERQPAIESLLLHVAGLVPSEAELAEAPAESREYASRLTLLWAGYEPFWRDRKIAPTRRWYRSIRPVNFPCRRIAAVAELIARSQRTGRKPLEQIEAIVVPWMRELEKAQPARKTHPVIAELCAWFEIDSPRSFWETHYSFTAKPSARKMTLLGESTARSLVFNAVLPALVLAAEKSGNESLARAAHRIYAIFPPLQSNHITEFMSKRLFGDDRAVSGLVTTERRQQALFQIFHACCNGEEKHCDACHYMQQT